MAIEDICKTMTSKQSSVQNNFLRDHLTLQRHFVRLIATTYISQKEISRLRHGASFDTGAHTSIIGLQLSQAYTPFLKSNLCLKKGNPTFRFGSDLQ